MFKKKSKKETKEKESETKAKSESRKSSHFKQQLEDCCDCISRIIRLFGGVRYESIRFIVILSDEDDELTCEYVVTMEDMDRSIKVRLLIFYCDNLRQRLLLMQKWRRFL